MRTIIFLLVAAVIVGGVALYGLFGVTKQSSEDTQAALNQSSDIALPPQQFLGEGSLFALGDLAANVECRISYVAPDMIEPVIGTYFVADGRMRGDFELSVPELGGQIVSSVIYTPNMVYSWSTIDGERYGVQASIESTDVTGGVESPVPMDALISYDCTEWPAVDNSIFVPPSDVLFQDATAIMETGMEYGTVFEASEF